VVGALLDDHAADSTRALEPGHGEVLQLEPLLDAVLRALAADARLLHAAERRHLRRDEARVQRDDARLERLTDAPRATDVPREEVGSEAEGRAVRDPDGLLLGVERDQARNRAEPVRAG